MARNTLAGKIKGKSKTSKHYKKNKRSRKKKLAYDSEYQKTKKPMKFSK